MRNRPAQLPHDVPRERLRLINEHIGTTRPEALIAHHIRRFDVVLMLFDDGIEKEPAAFLVYFSAAVFITDDPGAAGSEKIDRLRSNLRRGVGDRHLHEDGGNVALDLFSRDFDLLRYLGRTLFEIR